MQNWYAQGTWCAIASMAALVVDSCPFGWHVGMARDDAPGHIFEGGGTADEDCAAQLQAVRRILPDMIDNSDDGWDGCVLVTVAAFDDLGSASLRSLVRGTFSHLNAVLVSVCTRELLAAVACGTTTALVLNIDGDSTGRRYELSTLGVWWGHHLPETARRISLPSPQALSADSLLEQTELARVVVDAVWSAPIDVRQALLGNIVLSGRATTGPMMQRLQEKLTEQLNGLLEDRGIAIATETLRGRERVVKVVATPERKYLCWIGGSVVMGMTPSPFDMYCDHALSQDRWEALFQEHNAADSRPRDEGAGVVNAMLLVVPADASTAVRQREQRARELVSHAAYVHAKLPYELVLRISSHVAQGMRWPLARGQVLPTTASTADWAKRYDQQQRPLYSAVEMSEWAEWWPSLHGADPECRVVACSLFATTRFVGLASGREAAERNADAVRAEIQERVMSMGPRLPMGRTQNVAQSLRGLALE